MGVCRRGYRDIFWSVFYQGKVCRGGRGSGWRDGEKLFVDRLKRWVCMECWLPIGGGLFENGVGGKSMRCGVKYCDKTSFLDDEWKRCTGASACCWERPKNGKYPHWMKSRFCAKGGIYFTVLKCCFWWYMKHFSGQILFLLFRRVYSAILSRSILHVAGCFFCSLIIDTLPGVSYLIFISIYRLYTFWYTIYFPL